MPALDPNNLPSFWTLNPTNIKTELPATAIVFDIDGVLAHGAVTAEEAQQKIDAGVYDTIQEYLQDVMRNADPLHSGIALLNLIDPELTVILLTSRDAGAKDLTIGWVEQHSINWHLLITRELFPTSSTSEYKSAAVAELQTTGFDIRLVIDDDPSNVSGIRSMGVPCMYIHSGYYPPEDTEILLAETPDTRLSEHS